MKNSGLIGYNRSPMIGDDEEELSKSALLAFRVKEEEIKKKKMEVREKVHAQLGRVEEETKKLSEIREVRIIFFIVCMFILELIKLWNMFLTDFTWFKFT